MRPSSSRRAALTLVEIMFALGILAILALSVFGTLAYAQRAETVAREHEAASDALVREVDLLLARPDFDAIAGTTAPFPVTNPSGVGALPPSGLLPPLADDPGTPEDESAMAGRVEVVRDPDADGSANLLELRGIVAWRSGDGTDQRVDLVTRRAR